MKNKQTETVVHSQCIPQNHNQILQLIELSDKQSGGVVGGMYPPDPYWPK